MTAATTALPASGRTVSEPSCPFVDEPADAGRQEGVGRLTGHDIPAGRPDRPGHDRPESSDDASKSEPVQTPGWDPEAIARARFVVGLRGYNREDVEAFLRGVAENYGRVLRELEELRANQSAANTEKVEDPEIPETPDQSELVAAGPVEGSVTEEPSSPTGSAPVKEVRPMPEMIAGEDKISDGDSRLAALLMGADSDAWRIRDEAERAFDEARAEVLRITAEAETRAEQFRAQARREASEILAGQADIAEAATSVARLLTEADGMANQSLQQSTGQVRSIRRRAYNQLLDAEQRARDMVARAHEEAFSLLRSMGDPP